MEFLEHINSWLNNLVWGPYMLVLLVGTGIYLTIRTNFFTITRLGYVLKNTLAKMFVKDVSGEGEITPFQAVATALAATVGTGNIAGVATAIAVGGPGAIFWMWVSAVFGMATKFAEVVLGVHFRQKTEDGRFVGGPMYYLENGLKSRWLGLIFSIFAAFAAFGIGNMVQSNSVAAALKTTFNIPTWITGLVLAGVAALVIFGGLKRIASFTEKLVPFMAGFYIIGALIIIIINIENLPTALSQIFGQAFTGTAALGGFAGSTISIAMRRGISRGVFSNEAGLGSAPIAHAAATTDHPVRQGLWGVFEVFADTLVICTLTALTILTTGVWTAVDAAGNQINGAALTTLAFSKGLPGSTGGYIVSIGILLFAFSTILSWEYYGERAAEHIFGSGVNKIYKFLWIPFIFIGTVVELKLVWDIADTMNGLMAVPNLIGLLALSGLIIKLTKEFFAKEKLNK